MNDNSVNFIKPEEPLIIVKQLTQQFIFKAAINEYALNDGYWLKLHQFADTVYIFISILNNLLEEHRKELETFD